MINFARAFDSAWERMSIILFRPFDLGKWFVIGVSAFLAGLLNGGNGLSANNGYRQNYNFSTNSNGHFQAQNIDIHGQIAKVLNSFSTITTGVFVIIFVLALIFGFAIGLLMVWLGSRGQFMLIDNIVRNRGAIGVPWQYYARQANSFFALYLIFIVVSFCLIIPIAAIVVVMSIPLYEQNRWPNGGEIAGFTALGLTYAVVALVFTLASYLFKEFGIPIMFRRGVMAREALMETFRLTMQRPGSIAVFVLLRFALFLGIAIVSLIVCCVTCCIGLLPYIGTVLLLPAILYIKCFSLDCLAQFGPEYDVFTVDAQAPPPAGASYSPGYPVPPPTSPPLPPL